MSSVGARGRFQMTHQLYVTPAGDFVFFIWPYVARSETARRTVEVQLQEDSE